MMNERIRQIRNNAHLTQEKFAERLGIKRNTVATYETTEKIPMDSIITSICREFNVREEWLRHGTGEMYNELSGNDIYMKAVSEISIKNDKYAMQAIIEYWKLKDENKRLIWDYLKRIVDNSKE